MRVMVILSIVTRSRYPSERHLDRQLPGPRLIRLSVPGAKRGGCLERGVRELRMVIAVENFRDPGALEIADAHVLGQAQIQRLKRVSVEIVARDDRQIAADASRADAQ